VEKEVEVGGWKGVNCSSIGWARDDGVWYSKGMLTVTEDVSDMRTHRFQSQAILRRNQMKELRGGGEVVDNIIAVSVRDS